MKLSIKKGATSVILDIFIADSSSTTGAGLTGLTSASAGLTAYFARPDQGNAGGTAITLASATRGTYTSGGFIEKDATNLPGVYEFHPPNTAVATGARCVLIMLKGATNMAPLPLEIELTGWDNQDATAGGLGNLDAAVSTRSTYAGADTAGTTTLLGRLTSGRSTNLDNLDAAVSTRSTYAGADTAGTTTLLTRLSATRAGLLDNLSNLDALVSGVAAGVWAVGTRTLTSFGTLAADVWAVLTSTLTTASTIGKLFVDNINATISSRLASVGYTAPDNTSVAAIKLQTDKLTFTSTNVNAQLKAADADSLTSSALAASAVTEIAAGVTGAVVEGSMTLAQFLSAIGALVAGQTSGAGTTTVTFKKMTNPASDAVVFTVVPSTGERTAAVITV